MIKIVRNHTDPHSEVLVQLLIWHHTQGIFQPLQILIPNRILGNTLRRYTAFILINILFQ